MNLLHDWIESRWRRKQAAEVAKDAFAARYPDSAPGAAMILDEDEQAYFVQVSHGQPDDLLASFWRVTKAQLVAIEARTPGGPLRELAGSAASL